MKTKPYTREEWNRKIDEDLRRIEKNYRQVGDRYICRKCGATVKKIVEHHPKWKKGIEGGPGEVLVYPVPYCPYCEDEPEEDRTPIEWYK